MDQEKIGRFISVKRKEKGITQQELAEKLGVSDRTVGNWENGRNMPDLSLFKPLCEELNISINELLSGEELNTSEYQEKLEENIINTIDYGNKKNNKTNNFVGTLLIILGIMISLCSMFVFKNDNVFCLISLVFGCLLYLNGIVNFTKGIKFLTRIIFNLLFILIFMCSIYLIDYFCVINMHQVPRFAYSKISYENMIVYETFFYDVYRINPDTVNEYYIVDKEKEYTIDTVSYTPFDREKSGIESIIKYRNYNIKNIENTGELLEHLPLSEYEFTFDIDNEELGLIINYNAKNFRPVVSNYLKKALIYNSVSIFTLITNVEYIDFNFELPYDNVSYHIEREFVEELYPDYKYIIQNNIDKYNFNRFLEEQINSYEFVMYNFKQLFIDSNLKKTSKVDVIGLKEKIVENESVFELVVFKTIEDKKLLNSLIEMFLYYNRMPENAVTTSEGNAWTLAFKDEDGKVICTLEVWYSGWFGPNGKEYAVESYEMLINLLK